MDLKKKSHDQHDQWEGPAAKGGVVHGGVDFEFGPPEKRAKGGMKAMIAACVACQPLGPRRPLTANDYDSLLNSGFTA